MNVTSESAGALPLRRIFSTWWPLAASWLLMGIELPALSAAVARLPNPEVNLAAYGGVVFPISLIIEAPIIMLLSASTALSKDWASYARIRRYMIGAGAILTALHIAVAFTPLYYLVVEGIIGAPAEVVEPARLGLQLMTPWTWAIAYRRFNQGVLIRFGHSDAIGVGTAIRLAADAGVLLAGYFIGTLPGIAVAAGAVATGVIAEAIYAAIRVRPVLRDELRPAPKAETLTWGAFARFYVPLGMTSLIMLLLQPIGSAALSRMPDPLISLATWPVLSGLVFMLRSAGMGYNEVVVALLDRPGSWRSLRRFAALLAAGVTLFYLLFAATPLAYLWFSGVSALKPELAALARQAFWLALPIPALTVLQSWFQGAILHGRETRGVPESVTISLVVVSAILVAGIAWGQIAGLHVAMFGFAMSSLVQATWLWVRSRHIMRVVRIRDERFEQGLEVAGALSP